MTKRNNLPASADTLVAIHGDHPATNTLILAEHFGKQHKDVLRALEGLECSEEFRRRNFAPSSYYNQQGKRQPMYEVTRDGFMFLAMGFTGPTAARMKEGFIAAFNAMEAALRSREPVLNEAVRAELLRANPVWGRILRYRGLGLTLTEIGQLVCRAVCTVRRDLRRMEACGLIAPPPNLARMQACAQHLIGGTA